MCRIISRYSCQSGSCGPANPPCLHRCRLSPAAPGRRCRMFWLLEHPSPSIFSMRSVSRSSSFISFMRVSALSRTFLYASRASLRTSFPSPAAVSPNSLRASLYSSFFMTVYFKSCFWPVARLIKTLLQKRGQSVSQPSGDGCPVRSPILRNMQTIVFFAVNPYLADSINAYGNFMVSLLSPSVMTLAILIVSFS